VKETLENPDLKLQQTVISLELASQKNPAQREAIFLKGIDKFQVKLILAFNSLLLTLGSANSDSLFNSESF
jgi:hypothetical protein